MIVRPKRNAADETEGDRELFVARQPTWTKI
jgi:hypothetical protein